MSKYAVVDANVMMEFQKERIATKQGVAVEAINHIISAGKLLFDDKGRIQHEWFRTISGAYGENLSDWLADQMQMGRVHIIGVGNNVQIKKKLDGFGVPNDDRIYIKTAIDGSAQILVTEDIDFHNPKLKQAAAATRENIKRRKNGCVCKYLKDEYGILVRCIDEVTADFL